MTLPDEVNLQDLVGDGEYVENARWTLFADLDPDEAPGRSVLLVLGDRWTVLKGDDFRALARRLLEQL